MYGRHKMHEEPVTCGCGLVRSPGRHRRGNQSEPVTRLYFDYIRVPSHHRQETSLVHPVTQKSAVQAEAIHSPAAPAPRFEATTPAPSTLPSNDTKKGGGRRRSGGSWVKTPGVRRPDPSTVTLQGWLYKQGADGLHLWKKRWFVLSEYCLYYYKGPEEDKALGSLPLPSFKISPVVSEDRVFRRHAFKAEHQNMRTYYFAAETKEQMAHWMNALSLASILQKDTSLEEKWSSGSSARRSERPSVSSLASTASPSADESDSGFHGYRSRRYRSPDGRSLDEASESSRLQGDRLNTSCDSSTVLRPGDRQPLYANAPPKPKRLNSSRDYSTSPERSPERDERDPRTYTDHGGGGNGAVESRTPDGRGLHYHPPAAERRTPDAYGVTACGGRGDYEDVYGDSNGSNSTPHSPIRRPDQRDSFASSRSGGTRLSEELQLSDPLRSNFCRQDDTLPRVSNPEPHHRHRPSGPPRPHSADFLDYDRRHSSNNMWSYRRGSGGDLPRPNEARPKSSVGQSESDHWSEENYAQKMRQSSLYHSHMHSRTASRYSPAGPGESPSSDHHHLHNPQGGASLRVPPAGAATPDLYTPHKPAIAPTPSNATNSLRRGAGQDLKEIPRQDVGQDQRVEMRQYSRQDPRQVPRQDLRQDIRPDIRQNHRQDPSQELHRTYNHEDPLHKHEISPNTTLNSVPTPPGSYAHSASPNGSINNNFMRSASARLPRHRLQDDTMNTSLPDDGSDGDSKKMQQREESMKRLLEWKQRMLQSPLTRKTSSRPDTSAAPQPRTNNEAYRQQVLNELVTQEARTKVLQGHMHTQSLLPGLESGLKSSPGSVAGISHGYPPSAIPGQPQGPANPPNWVPGNLHANQGSMNYGSINQGVLCPLSGMPGERPAPQGGSSHQGSDSGSSKRREGRRENSRTRHVSGGDSRRSTSASRYNSYSSDEDDLLEERETRKRTRRNSRRSSADLSRDSRRIGSAPESRGRESEERPEVARDYPRNYVNEYPSEHCASDHIPPTDTPTSSPDYVNINIVNESREGKHFSTPRGTTNVADVENLYNERTMSQRAEPVFIEMHEGYDEVEIYEPWQNDAEKSLSVSRNCEQSYVYNDQFYATRDPYYVSDVQMPAISDSKFEEERNGNSPVNSALNRELITSCDTQNSLQNRVQLSSNMFEQRDNREERRPSIDTNKSFLHNTSGREESLESSVGFSSYDSHAAHKGDSVSLHVSQRGAIQDDTTSTGKYSDSGYDTLRAEISLRHEEKKNDREGSVWNVDSLESSPECSSVVRRRGFDRAGRRPETWSPEKFDRSWGTIGSDLKSKVDESKVVREYSYEYITPEKNHEMTPQESFKNMSSSLKKSTPILPCLESPKMVQETHHQTQSQKNLVQDRIRKFTGKALDTKEIHINSSGELPVTQSRHNELRSRGDNQMANIESTEHPSGSLREPLKEPLKPVSPQVRSSEALVSPLKAEFATSESTVVTAQEAQVKNVSDYKRRDEVFGISTSEESPSASLRYNSSSEHSSIEYRELRSPQDIMDSRLSRTNIRKFLFDDDNKTEEIRQEQPVYPVKPPLMKKPMQPWSVKDLLKNFEERSIEHMERVNMNQDVSRKKFHSDSEMLSNESSSDEGQSEDLYTAASDKIPLSPTSSVLAELRKSADDKKEDMVPLVPPPRPPKKPTLGGDMDAVVTPGYLRLSLAESIQESLKVQENSDSGGEEPSWMDSTLNSEQGKHSYPFPENDTSIIIDLDKPPEEEAPPPPLYPPSNEPQSPLMQPDPLTEENYLPMSPPKKFSQGSSILASASSCSSLSSKHLPTPEPVYPDAFAKTEYEEHTYIEMSGDTSSNCTSVLASNASAAPRLDFSKITSEQMFTPESPRYYEIGDKDENQHYEYIYRGQPHYEAIYMEVPNSEKEDPMEDEKPQIPDKPVDLKAQSSTDRNYQSDPALNSSLSKLDLKSQSNASSDADDEASKDLDSLDPPRNPRFSLSDTFRPASYYLSGAEPSSDPDAQDSSDSDLVPPPPIPMSPPPMDELDTGGPKAKNFDFENLETPDPPPHLRNALSSSRSLRVSQSNLREDLNSSRSSIGKDKRIYEKSDSSASLHSDKLKRRPVFEETLESLHDDDSFILRSEDRYPASAAYPEDCTMPGSEKKFQRDRRKPFPQCAEEILLPGDKHEPSARPKSAVDHNSSFQSNLDTFSSKKIENPYVNEGFQHNARPPINSHQNPPVGREYCNIPPNAKMFMQPERERSNSTGSRPKSPDPYAEHNELSPYQNVPAPRTSLLRKNSPQITSSSVEPTGSPMIDALRGVHSPVAQLNVSHQRTSSEASSRSVVSPTASVLSGSGSVAPIHLRATSNASVGSETSPRSAPYYYSDVIRDGATLAEGMVGTPRSRSYQLNNQRDLEANKRQDIGRKVNQITSASDFVRDRLAHDLRTSVEFLEGKTVPSPDERNVYDSDTLRKMKRRAYTPDPELDAKNVFPHGLSIKTDSPISGPPVGHRRTRSLEGLLDDPPRSFVGGASNVPASMETKQMCISGLPQGSNLTKPLVSQMASSVPPGIRPGQASCINSSPSSPPPTLTPHRGAFSQLTSQRTSVSSLHSSGSIPQRATSPYATSPLPTSPLPSYQVGNRDSLVSRESSASRISYHDTRGPHELRSPTSHNTLHEEQDWEDDTQWREQLRRASVRHTRSLETLDEGRPRRPGDGSNTEGRPPARLSVPNNPAQVAEETNQQRLQQLHLDEYTVDYREGRVGSIQHKNVGGAHSETLERTRRGLTCLEGYEWDEAEERFKKPSQLGRLQQPLPQQPPNNMQHQPFLADGLPPSPEMECEDQRQCQQSPTLHLAPAPPSPRPQLQQHFLAGDGEGSDVSSGVGGRPPGESEGQEEQLAASPTASPVPEKASIITTIHPAPDVIPVQDVKLGESLPRRPDPNAPNSSAPQGSAHAHSHPHAHQKYQHHPHTHHQNYQHHPHPHSQNQYHHYKSDDLHKYQIYPAQNYQSNGPYTNYHRNPNYPHNYPEDHINYANNFKQAPNRPPNYPESQQQQLPVNPSSDYNNTLNSQWGRMNGTYRPSHYDFQDYHNYKNHQQDYKTQEYGIYGTHPRHHDQRLNGRVLNDIHQQQFSDSELTVSKHQQSATAASAAAAQESVEMRGLQGVSAGELLGKTHEELVLLLIQLRRHHSTLQSARHHTRLERDSQARLAQLDGEHREEHLRRLASLNHHLHDLDKQYEMGKPLINLVDNMVKLGSLYRGGDSRFVAQDDPRQPHTYYQGNGYDSLQFSRRIQERRIVAEDLQLQEYELAAADQGDLEGKVMQLYKLDKNLHQESLTIQSLQREKEMLERTLVNLNSKSHGANEGPVELERRKKQRRHLEHELSKLRAHLAVSARRLEETAAENSRLEHEMMMLRQKIQMTMARNSQRESGSTAETRHIESEMVRVQTLLEDLQRRRIELSHQIQKLTSANPGIEIRPSPTGVVGAAPVPARRRTHSTWLETDLDAMITRDRGMDPPEDGRRCNPPVYVNATGYVGEVCPNDFTKSPDFSESDYPPPPPPPEHMRSYNHHLDGQISLADHYQTDLRDLHSQSPLGESKRRQPLMNGDLSVSIMAGLDRDAADNKPDGEEQQQSGGHLDINDADDRMKRYYGILPKEKPLEIKTVRIVKRESTERRKDRSTGGKRVTIGDSSLTHLLEDDVESDGMSDTENEPPIPSFASRSASLPRNYGRNGTGERASMMAAMMRTSVGNSGTMARPSNLALKKSSGWKSKTENPKDRPLSAHEQLFGFSRETEQTPPASPSKSDPPSPVFKSAAAQEIIKEMASEAEKHRRAVPKEKRRHFTISSSRPMTLETRDADAEEGARSRDDCDMVRALRPRNHPDVVKSTLSTRDLRFNETTIDSILGAPSKIYIPERYMPDEDDEKELTEEERALREQKAESIRKMLSETQTTVTKGETGEEQLTESEPTSNSSSAFKAKVAAEKKEREHLLALNQILARQVMEKSRVVAANTTVDPHL